MAKNKGHKNLIPFDKRTEAEQRKIATDGGKASGEARRKRKSLKDSMNTLLDLPVTNAKDFNKVAKMGIDIEDIDNSQLIVLALFNRAKSGDVMAIKELRNLIGEDVPLVERSDTREAASGLSAEELKAIASDIIKHRAGK